MVLVNPIPGDEGGMVMFQQAINRGLTVHQGQTLLLCQGLDCASALIHRQTHRVPLRPHAGWFNEEGSHQNDRLHVGKGQVNEAAKVVSVFLILDAPFSLKRRVEPSPDVVGANHQAYVIWLQVQNICLPSCQKITRCVSADSLINASNPERWPEGLQHGINLQNVARSQCSKKAFPDWPGTTSIRDRVPYENDLAA